MYRRRVRECQRADGEGADRIDEVKATANASLHSFLFAAGAAGGAGPDFFIALREHPELSLEPPEDAALVLGEAGWRGCGLSARECELVQRFDPSSASGEGSIGFFLARMRKRAVL